MKYCVLLFTLALTGCHTPSSPMANTSLPDFDARWNYNDPAASEAAFRELLPAAESSGDVDYHAQLLTQIARAQGLQRKFDAAHQTLDVADLMLTADTKTARVRYLLERGRVFNSAGQKDKATPPFEQAWELSKDDAALSFHAVDAAHMLGIVEPPDAALAWNEKAIALAEASDNARTRRWLGSLLNNTGWTYHDRGEYERALDLFVKARQWHGEHGNAATRGIAKWTVARCYRSLGRLDEALILQRQREQELKDAGERDGYVCEEIGEILLAQGMPDEARPYLRQAYELLSKDEWLAANEPDRLKRLAELGGVASDQP